jgi:hypothetical protein
VCCGEMSKVDMTQVDVHNAYGTTDPPSVDVCNARRTTMMVDVHVCDVEPP